MREESGAATPEEFADYRGIELYDVQLEGAGAQLVVGPLATHILLPDKAVDPAERRWKIAHELGHYEMGHRAPPVSELCTPHPRRCSSRAERDDEDEANEWALMYTMPDAEVSLLCDRRPMTLDVVTLLARRCGVPPIAAALRLIGVTFRHCAAVLSQHGRIQWASPSLPLLAFMVGHDIAEGKVIGKGALARRFFDGDKLRPEPAQVPANAWIDGLSDDARIQEHSMEAGRPGAVLTMLWASNEPDVPRTLVLPPRLLPGVRDLYLSDEDTRALFEHGPVRERPCPFAPTWLDALLAPRPEHRVGAAGSGGTHAAADKIRS